MWEAETTVGFDRWFTDLGKHSGGRQAQIEIDAAIRILRTAGPTLGRPLVDTLNGSKHANMKELRVGTRDMVIRIAFAFDPRKKAMLLVGGNKAGVNQQRFYKQLVRKADAEFDSHLTTIRKSLELKRKSKDR